MSGLSIQTFLLNFYDLYVHVGQVSQWVLSSELLFLDRRHREDIKHRSLSTEAVKLFVLSTSNE